jgi:hypothetical protein
MNRSSPNAFSDQDPRHHTVKMRNEMLSLVRHLRDDVNSPRAAGARTVRDQRRIFTRAGAWLCIAQGA